ncbi:MAG: type IX secretion system PorP/SprF family membrane protein [Bacteroidia bacterium]|jgi:type IX secretion system PorP/SprF family membrane protein
MKTTTPIYRILFSLVLLFGTLVQAQQIPLYSQYYFNKFIYNPALTGESGLFDASLIGRRQYTGIDGYQTAAVTMSGSLSEDRIGLGLYYVNDVNNIRQQNSVYGNYAYNIKINDNQRFSLGLGIGVVNNSFNLNNIITTDPNDPTLSLLDNPAGAVLDASIGANFQSNGFQIGFSVPQFLSNAQKFSDNYNTTLSYTLKSHLMVMTSYDIEVNENFKIQPLVLYKNVGNAPGQIDVNVMADWKNAGWLGAGYRDGYGVTLMAGLRLAETVRFGYSYDFSTGEYSTALGGTHEFQIGISTGGFGSGKAETQGKELDALQQASNRKQAEQEARIKELEKRAEEARRTPTKDTVYVVKRIEVPASSGSTKGTGSTPKSTSPSNTNAGNGGNDGTEKIGDKTPGEFIVVAGSFSQEQNATVYFSQLINKGLSPYMYYHKATKIYYVHMGKFYFKEEAIDYLHANKSTTLRLWVKTL